MRTCQRKKKGLYCLGLQKYLLDFKGAGERTFCLEAVSKDVKEHSVFWKHKQHHL